MLQLTSPALPVGAYSYSEGLEYLCHQHVVRSESDLYQWLKRELQFGFITNEATIALRAHQGFSSGDLSALTAWNDWLSAARETEEIRLASWQMGQSLIKLWWQIADRQTDLTSKSIYELLPSAKDNQQGKGCNYAIAFGIVAASLNIDPDTTSLGYIYSWVSNLVSAAVRLVPLGQTAGQQVIFNLGADISICTRQALVRSEHDLEWCGWGASLASANHETQYSRLFRS